MLRKLQPLAASIICSNRFYRFKHHAYESLRLITRQPHEILFFLDIEHPSSYLMINKIIEIKELFKVDFKVYIVAPKKPEFDPEPLLSEKYALRDTYLLAQAWEQPFPNVELKRDPRLIVKAHQVLLQTYTASSDWLKLARQVCKCFWQRDEGFLDQIIKRQPLAKDTDFQKTIQKHTRMLYQKGGFKGASIRYAGEWYYGLDRIHLLERRLAATSTNRIGNSTDNSANRRMTPNWQLLSDDADSNAATEMFFSFRSPYSYLAIWRLYHGTYRTSQNSLLVLKPVLPMVTRGLPVPRQKRMYILQDAARIARLEHIPFGKIQDPLGDSVTACIHLFYSVKQEMRLAISYELMSRIWSKGQDISDAKILKSLCIKYKVKYEDIILSIEKRSSFPTVEENRKSLAESELWGVPSFRKGAFSVWGQDRMAVIFNKTLIKQK